MLKRFLPRETNFFEYFEQHAAMIIEACKAFFDLVHGKADYLTQAANIKSIEQQADALAHRCIDELNHTFITPIDRVDIYQLTNQLDNIVDSVDSAASRIALYGLTEMRTEALLLAEVLRKCSVEIEAAIKSLRKPGTAEDLKRRIINIHQFENEGDIILRTALTRLFKEETDPILIIKWKEIFERLEKVTDRCEEIAYLIEKIVIEAS
ncbi:MAG: DUF47 domain-containing protein [Candidatus Hydrogenedentes bacterium]|nr:DUF47 domain-containing protein [Candidatus Hydrogenedentota bacterium]